MVCSFSLCALSLWFLTWVFVLNFIWNLLHSNFDRFCLISSCALSLWLFSWAIELILILLSLQSNFDRFCLFSVTPHPPSPSPPENKEMSTFPFFSGQTGQDRTGQDRTGQNCHLILSTAYHILIEENSNQFLQLFLPSPMSSTSNSHAPHVVTHVKI